MTDIPDAARARITRKVARKWIKRVLLALVSLIGVLVLIVLGTFGFVQFKTRQAVTLPAPSGPYQVGRAMYDWTDSSRVDQYSPGRHSPRELSVWAWYPASVPHGSRRAAYLPPAWQQAVQAADLTHTRADAVTTHSWENVPVANTAQPYPVLVFMPGFGRVVADYTTMAEDLASHGYAVFGVNPTYFSSSVVLGHGRVVGGNEEVANRTADPAMGKAVVEVEAADLRFVLDEVKRLDHALSERFEARLDTSRVGFFGHSMGGAGATRACQLEPRCQGAANIDGALHGQVIVDGIGKPYLFVGEDPSISAPPAAALHGVLQQVPAGEGHVLTVTGAGHMNFSDVGVLYGFPPDQFGFIGPINGARALAITRAYLGAFFGAHLRDQASPLLSGQAPGYPEVHVVKGFS